MVALRLAPHAASTALVTCAMLSHAVVTAAGPTLSKFVILCTLFILHIYIFCGFLFLAAQVLVGLLLQFFKQLVVLAWGQAH